MILNILNAINPEWLQFIMEHTIHIGGGTVYCYAQYLVYGKWINPSNDPDDEMIIEPVGNNEPICMN